MSKEVIENHYCDVCKSKEPKKLIAQDVGAVSGIDKLPNNAVIEISYPIWFVTDQTEGRGSRPYISQQKIEVCAECLNKIVRISGSGAQGYNDYFLRK